MSKPNIILILCDSFRRDAVGTGTPNLMELAARGMRFSNAYCVSPLCQPTRTSVITGMYRSQTGVCGNESPPINERLRCDTFMNHLQKAGYYTALIGKHHYIDTYASGPMDVTVNDDEIKKYGFDHVFQVTDEGECLRNEDGYTGYLRKKHLLEKFRRAISAPDRSYKHPLEEADTTDSFIGTKAAEFINNYNRQAPFYLNLGFVGPHPPYWHAGELPHDAGEVTPPINGIDNEETRQCGAHYMDKCGLIDRHVGRLVNALEELGMLENTILIFTSDHGTNLGDYGIWDKRFFFETTVGIPLIMCGPGIEAVKRANGPKLGKAMVSQLDFYPTILALSQASSAENKNRPGLNLLEVLRNERKASRSEIFAQLGTAVMARTGNWKMVFDPEQGGVQYLFNLVIDADEKQNLAGVVGYESVTRDLLELLLSNHIRLHQFTDVEEEQRIQRVRIGKRDL